MLPPRLFDRAWSTWIMENSPSIRQRLKEPVGSCKLLFQDKNFQIVAGLAGRFVQSRSARALRPCLPRCLAGQGPRNRQERRGHAEGGETGRTIPSEKKKACSRWERAQVVPARFISGDASGGSERFQRSGRAMGSGRAILVRTVIVRSPASSDSSASCRCWSSPCSPPGPDPA